METISRRNFIRQTAAMGAGIGLLSLTGCGTEQAAASAPEAAPAAEQTPLHVRAVIFSPTGGTLNAGLLVASELSQNVEVIDQTPLSARKDTISFEKDQLAVLAAPSYAGKIPFAQGLFENIEGKDTPCVIVTAFGNRACENNFAQVHKLATDRGFVVVGAISIVTPHVFGARAGHGRPDMTDRAQIRKFAASVLKKLESGTPAAITVEGEPALGPRYVSDIEKVYDAEKCVKCNACVNNCPVGAINANTLEIDPELCIHCQRCTFVCNYNARDYLASREAVDDKYAARQEVEFIV